MGARPKSQGTEPSCLYPDDAEIAAIVLGPRASLWTGLAAVLERSGLPKIDPQTGGRYWPKVKAFLDRRENVDQHEAPRPRGIVENFDGARPTSRARS